MTPAEKQALLDVIAGSKGFVGIHSCSDTCHSPGSEANFSSARYKNDGDQADPYIKMLGGEFIMHGKQQPGQLIKADPKFPGLETVPANFQVTEEWYSLKNFPAYFHVLFVQDVSGMTGDMYDRPNYPSTWVRLEGQGRVFYASMGHRDDIWTNPIFQTVLAAGLNWSLKRVDADVTPNLATVAPKASELPLSPKNK